MRLLPRALYHELRADKEAYTVQNSCHGCALQDWPDLYAQVCKFSETKMTLHDRLSAQMFQWFQGVDLVPPRLFLKGARLLILQ